MNDSLQIILIIMLIVVIIFFIILGIQIFFLIQEARKTIIKANKVLDNTSDITDSISEPLLAISGIIGSLGSSAILSNILKIIIKIVSNSSTKKKKGDDDE